MSDDATDLFEAANRVAITYVRFNPKLPQLWADDALRETYDRFIENPDVAEYLDCFSFHRRQERAIQLLADAEEFLLEKVPEQIREAYARLKERADYAYLTQREQEILRGIALESFNNGRPAISLDRLGAYCTEPLKRPQVKRIVDRLARWGFINIHSTGMQSKHKELRLAHIFSLSGSQDFSSIRDKVYVTHDDLGTPSSGQCRVRGNVTGHLHRIGKHITMGCNPVCTSCGCVLASESEWIELAEWIRSNTSHTMNDQCACRSGNAQE